MKVSSRSKATQKKQLLEAAHKALTCAYSPYSRKRVGSAVIADDGEIYSGCNVENASFGATVCAERVAIWKAISEGAKRIQAILILSHSKRPWAPCGMCRQVLLEFATESCPVYLVNMRGQGQTYSLGELCPVAFSPKQMKKNQL